MVLDAILKTKSRMVLLDIINKNGIYQLPFIVELFPSSFIKCSK